MQISASISITKLKFQVKLVDYMELRLLFGRLKPQKKAVIFHEKKKITKKPILARLRLVAEKSVFPFLLQRQIDAEALNFLNFFLAIFTLNLYLKKIYYMIQYYE